MIRLLLILALCFFYSLPSLSQSLQWTRTHTFGNYTTKVLNSEIRGNRIYVFGVSSGFGYYAQVNGGGTLVRRNFISVHNDSGRLLRAFTHPLLTESSVYKMAFLSDNRIAVYGGAQMPIDSGLGRYRNLFMVFDTLGNVVHLNTYETFCTIANETWAVSTIPYFLESNRILIFMSKCSVPGRGTTWTANIFDTTGRLLTEYRDLQGPYPFATWGFLAERIGRKNYLLYGVILDTALRNPLVINEIDSSYQIVRSKVFSNGIGPYTPDSSFLVFFGLKQMPGNRLLCNIVYQPKNVSKYIPYLCIMDSAYNIIWSIPNHTQYDEINNPYVSEDGSLFYDYAIKRPVYNTYFTKRDRNMNVVYSQSAANILGSAYTPIIKTYYLGDSSAIALQNGAGPSFILSKFSGVGRPFYPGIATTLAKPTLPGEYTATPQPNPTANRFTIPGVGREGVLILVNASGRVVRQENFAPGSEVDISALPKGLYLFRLVSEGAVTQGKVVRE